MLLNYIASPSQNVLSSSANTSLYVWGDNSAGQLGTGDVSTLAYSQPVAITNFLQGNSFSQIKAGTSHALAIDTNNRLWAWGDNTFGQIGNNQVGAAFDAYKPQLIEIGGYWYKQVSAGGSHTAAIRVSDNSLWTWGLNSSGQLGDGTTINKSSPVQVTANGDITVIASSWKKVACAGTTTLAIRGSDSSLWAWGDNASGQLGDGTTVTRYSPVKIGNNSWTTVSVNDGNFSRIAPLAIDITGALYAWGHNGFGQIGDGTTINKSSPVKIGSSSWSVVTTLTLGSAAIDSTGALYTWGINQFGPLGDDTTINKSSPVKIGSSSWSVVDGGSQNIAAIDTTGALYVWGWNQFGQIGDGTTINKSSPVKIGSSSWSVVSGGTSTTAAIDTTGALYTWGSAGTTNILGDNGVSRSSPVQLGTNSWTFVVMRDIQAGAIDITGALYTWGSNVNGKLGDGTTTNRTSPVKIGNSSWTTVSIGDDDSSAAIDITGALYTWGTNTNGQLGLGDPQYYAYGGRSSPVLVATYPYQRNITITSWQSVDCSFEHTVAIANTGVLYTWGSNNFGQLGDGTTINKSSPVKIGSNSWNMVRSKYDHTVAIDSTGALYTWGSNILGGLGDRTTINKSSPVKIGSSSWSMASGGYDHTAAIDATGALYTWGRNDNSGLGDGTTTSKSSPVKIGNSSWSMVTAGLLYSTAIDSTGALYTWGYNFRGQLGDGTIAQRSSPVKIGNSSWNSVSTGGYTTAAIDSTGSLYTWGQNSNGQLGDNTIDNKSSPVKIGNSSWSVIGTNLGDAHTIAILSNGTLFTWGRNNVGQLGRNNTLNTSSPVQVGLSQVFVKGIGTAGNTSLAITQTNLLYAWGDNSQGQVGDGTLINRSAPTQIFANYLTNVPDSWKFVSVGYAIRGVDSSLWSWGRGNEGALGDGSTISKSYPVKIGTSSWSIVCRGNGNGAGIDSTGALYTWGQNGTSGSLGDGTTVSKSSPVLITVVQPVTYDSWKMVSGGLTHTAAIQASDSSLWTWGFNFSGQLGDGTTSAGKSSPVKIGNSSWNMVSVGGSHTAAIDITGALYTWGANDNGQLGDGTTINKSSPIKIGSGSWSMVSVGQSYTAAIDITGALYTWGGNATYGQLGDGTTVNKSSPVKIGSSSWIIVSCGIDPTGPVTAAIDSTGALYTWGRNTQGQLGDNTTTSKSSPVKIGSSSWSTVSSGGYTLAGIDTTGALYGWGYNLQGQVGDGTAGTSKSSPVKIGSSSWSKVSVGPTHTVAIDTTGALYAWGFNQFGQLGGGITVNRSSPVKIGSNSWSMISAGSQYSAAIDSTGALYTWGLNSLTFGALGDGTKVDKSSPVQVATTYNVINSWIAVSLGAAHGLALAFNKTLWVWGINSSGQLGDGTTVNKSNPILFPGSWNAISGSQQNSIAIDSTGALYTWGQGTSGTLGDGTVTSKSSPVKIGSSSWSVVSAGWFGSHVLAIDITGALYAWGLNANGQVGDGTTINKSSPIKIGSSSWSKLSAGGSFSSAIDSTGALYTWGQNASNQLGDNTTFFDKSSPVKIGSSSWSVVGMSNDVSGAIDINGNLYTWGNSLNSYLGDGITNIVGRSSPAIIGFRYSTETSFSNIISSGFGNFFYVLGANTARANIYTWGTNTSGQLGRALGSQQFTPIDPIDLNQNYFLGVNDSWKQLSSSGTHTVAIRASDSSLWAWGGNFWGQLGDGMTLEKSSPVKIGNNSWNYVAAGIFHTLAIDTTGALYAWGLNDTGQLGDNTLVNKSSPIKIGSSSWSVVGTGVRTSQAIDITGALYTWGRGFEGQLGDGTTIFKSTPVKIGNNSWSKIGTGKLVSHVAAIDSTGALYTWGWNGAGNLGDGTTVSKSSPVKIGSSSWSVVNAGNSHTVGIDITGALYTWGQGANGQLGDGTTISKSSPIKIGSSSWSVADAGGLHSAAIDITGALYTWGINNSAIGPGTLGDGTTVSKSSPVKIGSRSWNFVACGDATTGGIAEQQKLLFMWGNNQFGPLGDGTNLPRSSPVVVSSTGRFASLSNITQINTGVDSAALLDNYSVYTIGNNNAGQLGDSTTVSKNFLVQQYITRESPKISVGASHMVAIAANTLYAWGLNSSYQLGDGTSTNRSSPVVISGLPTNLEDPSQDTWTQI